jgi:hypothetical protein
MFNPQNLNRFSYVRNNPILYTDPSGHAICLDGIYCGTPTNTSYQNYVYSVSSDDGSESESGSGLSGGGGTNDNTSESAESNICQGNPPHLPEYTCGIETSDPAYLTPARITDPVVGDDTFSDFYWQGKIEENQSSTSRAVNSFFLALDIFAWLHYNTSMHGRGTGQYTLAAIPYAHNNVTNKTIVPGLFVINKTSSNLTVKSIEINNQPYYFERNIVAPDSSAGYIFPAVTLSQHGSIKIKVNVLNSTGWGVIKYSGPVYLP